MVAMIEAVEDPNAGIPNVSVVKETVPRDLEVQCLLSETSTKSETSSNLDRLEVA